MRLDIIRPDAYRATIMRDCFVELTLVFQRQTEIVFSHPTVWILRQRGLIKGDEIMVLCGLMERKGAENQDDSYCRSRLDGQSRDAETVDCENDASAGQCQWSHAREILEM